MTFTVYLDRAHSGWVVFQKRMAVQYFARFAFEMDNGDCRRYSALCTKVMNEPFDRSPRPCSAAVLRQDALHVFFLAFFARRTRGFSACCARRGIMHGLQWALDACEPNRIL